MERLTENKTVGQSVLMKMKTAHGAQKFSHVFIKSWARPNGLPYKVILQGDGKLYWDVHAAIK